MNNLSIYTNLIETKNHTKIPVLKSGRTVESRYNPQTEAERTVSTFDNKSNCFLVLGISSGILIKTIHEAFPHSLIIGVEITVEDIFFVEQQNLVNELKRNLNIHFVSLNELKKTLIDNYIPAKYGDLKIVDQKNWITENIKFLPEIKNIINTCINMISADFSVQAHFGKIWTINILNNIKLLSKLNCSYNYSDYENKTAYILAAGPSLEKSICNIQNSKSSFIISTDTALPVLQKHHIIPDIVISIDGQFVSHNHFTGVKISSKTLFLFELSSNFSAAKYISQKTNNISFFISNHPMENLFNQFFYNNNLPKLYSGSGTVTITALNLAISLGFSKIQVLAADFSYINQKTYTKGTYLDLLYNKDSMKIFNNEHQFAKLLYRTELISLSDSKKTTKILESYKKSFIDYLDFEKINYKYGKSIYFITNDRKPTFNIKNLPFDFKEFTTILKKAPIEKIEYCLLPLVSYFRNSKQHKNLTDYNDLLNLAHSFIVSYN